MSHFPRWGGTVPPPILWGREDRGGLVIAVSNTLRALPGVTHGYTTRTGGISGVPYESLNLGGHVGDTTENVAANRMRLLNALGIDADSVVTAEQVHGNSVAVADNAGPIAARVDSLITQRRGLLLLLMFADCVPIYIVDPVRSAIGLAHSGWRGTAANIVQCTLAAMEREYGTRPANTLVAIGPAIAGVSYEVDIAVAGHFSAVESLSRHPTRPNRYCLDLRGVIAGQAIDYGVPSTHVSVSDDDTFADGDSFFSFRRDGVTGRNAAFLALHA
ncbi:MAG: peptidoglycan editing factor PgeF [Capsulimonadaceae bacterium]